MVLGIPVKVDPFMPPDTFALVYQPPEGSLIIELSHPSDPRYLLVAELPERVSVEDAGSWKYGKPLLFAPGEVAMVYQQPDGFGTDWVKPT